MVKPSLVKSTRRIQDTGGKGLSRQRTHDIPAAPGPGEGQHYDDRTIVGLTGRTVMRPSEVERASEDPTSYYRELLKRRARKA